MDSRITYNTVPTLKYNTRVYHYMLIRKYVIHSLIFNNRNSKVTDKNANRPTWWKVKFGHEYNQHICHGIVSLWATPHKTDLDPNSDCVRYLPQPLAISAEEISAFTNFSAGTATSFSMADN